MNQTPSNESILDKQAKINQQKQDKIEKKQAKQESAKVGKEKNGNKYFIKKKEKQPISTDTPQTNEINNDINSDDDLDIFNDLEMTKKDIVKSEVAEEKKPKKKKTIVSKTIRSHGSDQKTRR